MPTRPRHIAAALTALAVLAACSSDDDGGASATTSPSTAEAQDSTSAATTPEDAAVGMLTQFAAGDWAPFYDALHPAQQDLISRDQYIRCGIDTGLVDVLSRAAITADNATPGTVELPGTGRSVDGFQVTIRFDVDGAADSFPFNIVDDGDGWRWVMSNLPDVLADC